ncbi:hypothetical protein GGI35DRAFT_97932 [Trichoderma velutinum]
MHACCSILHTLQATFPLMSWPSGMARLCPRRYSSFYPGRWSCRSKTFDGRHPQPSSILSAASHPYRRYHAAPPMIIRDALPRPWSRCRLPLQPRRPERGAIKMATWEMGNDDGPARLKQAVWTLAQQSGRWKEIGFISFRLHHLALIAICLTRNQH